MSLWIAIPAVILVFVLGLLVRIGFFSKRTFVLKSTDRMLFLYVENVGPYMKLGDIFHNIYRICVPEFGPNTITAGIYYDNPSIVLDANKCRSSCGVLLDFNDRAKALEFIAKNPIYKLRELPPVECVSVSFRNFGMLTYMLMPMRVYPQLTKYLTEHGHFDNVGPSVAMMEIYHYNQKPNTMEILYPHGPGKENYNLTTLPAPRYKEQFRPKSA